MTGADRAIRWSTIAAVSVVALVAGSVSYRHALTVVRAHGEPGWLAYAYPLMIDGLVYAASMVLLNAARRRLPRPPLAYFALGLGIAATLAANVAAGLAYGPVGALVASWPAPALVISYELLMLVIRTSARPEAPAPEPAVPADVDEAVRLAHLAAVAAGEPVSQRQLAERFSVSRRQVSQALARLNGHGPDPVSERG